MESISGRQARQKDKEIFWSPLRGKSFAEVVKQNHSTGEEVARVRVDNSALCVNLEKLAHCLVGCWNSTRGGGEDLRSLAKLEDGKALLEFGLLSEAEKALDMAEISVGGFVIRLEKWSPRLGCLMEEEKVREAWVRIVGLPISLWNRDILSKVGEACGGFLGLDAKTERMEELQWARIRVRKIEEKTPNMVEIWVGDMCYSLTLWWETRPTLSVSPTGGKGKAVVTEGETQSADGTRRLTSGSGRPMECSRGPYGLQLKPSGEAASEQLGGLSMRPLGPRALINPPPGASLGPKENKRIVAWRPTVEAGLAAEKEPSDHLAEAQRCSPSHAGSPPSDMSLVWEKNGMRWLGEAELLPLERSMTDLALVEEASRYVLAQSDCLIPVLPSSPLSFFGRTPLGEYCDPSGLGEKCDEDENPLQMLMGMDPPVSEPVECWDLVEASKDRVDVNGKGLGSDQIVPIGNKAGGELSWEKSDLAKFSKFLGFSTEGLEKDIMEFLVKIRKRRESVHSKTFLEKSKFERELKRLECSINYEKEKNKMETKVQTLSEGLVRSLGSGRWSNWVALDALGSAGGILVWGDFNVTLSQRERSRQGRLSGAMRSFAQIVDDLELIDLPMQGGMATWNGGRNNQSWARLDRFLVTQQWLDMFSGVAQCRMHRPTSDHFPILLMGGGIRRGPTPFRFENMWLKVDGFIDLLRGWEVFGRWKSTKLCPSNLEYWDGVESEKSLTLKSRELWLKEGDRNTGYFHRMANAHRRNNSMDRIMINGELLTEDQEEIHSALMEMGGDKAPGPDGFSVAFWQECWDFVMEEVVEMFKEFFEHGSFAKSLNTTFLVLIPKKGGAEDLRDFRPISLLGVDQNAFVRGRRFWMLLYINWKFLMKVLRKMGFGSRWREWMWWCISTAKFSILINGVPAGFFSNSKGLRQGDPLSPYLFVLGMEVLSTLIRRAEQLANLSWILAWFEAASGLRINLAKSVLIPVGEVDEFGALPTVYLGLPLGAHHKTSSSWDGSFVRTDKWCGNEVLCQSLCEVWDSSMGQGGWNLSLARDLNDWEMEQIGDMLNLLKDFRTSLEEDSVRWRWEGNGVYGAKGAYKILSGSSAGVFPYRRIWMEKVPTKVSFFAWEASWGKILTLDKLQRRGWQLPNRCFLCGYEEESVESHPLTLSDD
ncbi:hypothetical protein AAG906_031374 [Vitis piasezkii]